MIWAFNAKRGTLCMKEGDGNRSTRELGGGKEGLREGSWTV